MEIIFIRHTTPKIDKGVCYGQADLDVSSTFKDETTKILMQLGKQNSETVYFSSPLKRCKKLAEKISKTIIFDDRLKELDFGDWELKKWKDIDKNEMNVWMNDFVNIAVTNGESYMDLHSRTIQFLSEITKKNYKKAVIVTHAGVIRSLYSHIKNSPLEKSFDLKLEYGQLLKITY
jgi:alpha-ribazole phosphatase